jgi:hypothetical protein
VKLKTDEREVVFAEIDAVRVVARDGYRELLDAIALALSDEHELADGEAAELERILSLGLQTGRIRALHGPGGEQAAVRVYRRLPGGSELTASAKQVSDALGALAGRSLDQISIAAVGPGAFTVSLVAGGAEVSVRLDQGGARLASVGV